jgi:hypothetical protein
MDGTNGLKETTRVAAPVASNTLSVNVFTAPGKTMVGERPRPFGEALGFDPITSTLIFGERCVKKSIRYQCSRKSSGLLPRYKWYSVAFLRSHPRIPRY